MSIYCLSQIQPLFAHTRLTLFWQNSQRMLSSDGRCKTLDSSADGYVRGEACGVIVLQSISGDNFDHSIIVGGSAVNQDGRSSSLTAPNGPSQQTVIINALRDAAVEGNTIQMLQMHGTGTSLGDPIEIGSVLATYSSYTERESLVLQAVKSMVGHTETAAGVMSMTQPLAHIVSCTSAEITHLNSLNPVIQSVYLSARKSVGDISAPTTQRQKAGMVNVSIKNDSACGVSGFAFQGTNGHLIVQRHSCKRGVHCVNGASSHFFVFDSSRHWVVPDVHTLVRGVLTLSESTGRAIAKIDPRTNAFFWEHKVSRRSLFPASGFLDVAACATTMLGGSFQTMQHEKVINHGSLQTPLLLREPASETCIFISIDYHDENIGAHITMDSSPPLLRSASSVKGRRRSIPHLNARCERMISAMSSVNMEDDANTKCTVHFHDSRLSNRTAKQQIANGVTIDQNTDYSPFAIHPAVLDSALHLSSACHVPSFTTNTSTPGLMIPAAFACYLAFAGCKKTCQLERRVTADVNRPLSMKRPDAQLSNHLLTALNDGLSAYVSELVVRRLRGPVSGESIQSVETKSAHMLARDMVYTIRWLTTPTQLFGGKCSIPSHNHRLQNLGDEYSNQMSRITSTAAQALQFKNEGSQSLQTSGLHPMRASSSMPCVDRSSIICISGSLWGLWSVANTESRGNQRSWEAKDISPNVPLKSQTFFSGSYTSASSSGVLANPLLIPMKNKNSTEGLQLNHEPARGTLITGGLGGLGLTIASWYSSNSGSRKDSSFTHSRPSVLSSRTGRTCQKSFKVLVKAPASITISSTDNASSEALRNVCSLADGKVPFAVTIHTAGALRDSMLVRQTVQTFRETAAPKVSRAVTEVLFHTMTSFVPMNATIAFSSIATVIGSFGQANYAAANAALESIMNNERAKGCVTRAVAWGAWQEVGMAAAGAADTAARYGMGSIKPSIGMIALMAVIRMDATVCRSSNHLDHGNVVISPFNWQVLARSHKAHTMPIPHLLKVHVDSVIEEYDEYPQEASSSEQPMTRSSVTSSKMKVPYPYAGLHGAAAIEAITSRLIMLISESTGATISVDDPLMESGLDSITGIELQQRAEQEFNIKLEPTATLDHPNPAALGRHIAATMGLLEEENVAIPIFNQVDISERQVGQEMRLSRGAAMYAGEVDGVVEFWKHMVCTNNDPQTQVALARYDIDEHYHPITVRQMGIVTTRFGAFLGPDLSERFDSDLLHISSVEALHMDPQQRLLLETCTRCLLETQDVSSADYTSNADIIRGVFVGCMYNETPHLQQIYDVDAGAHAGTGSGAAFMCGRVSYIFALTGPCVSTDTACSSSLVATHLARRSVENDECQEGLAAGVNLALTYINTSVVCAIGALSSVGRCKALDVAADGYGRGEGSGAILIHCATGSGSEPASLYAKLTASAVNQDGRSSALTAPHGPSQVVLLRDIAKQEFPSSLLEVDLAAGKMRFIAMHGTGTSLGDPIEVGALSKYAASISESVLLNAPKTHYGHTEGAAGIAGIFSALGYIESSEVAPIKHLRTLNLFVATAISNSVHFSETSLNVNASRSHASATMASNRMRIAGTSSFGMSGVNAHASVARIPGSVTKTDATDATGRNSKFIRFAKRFSYFPRPNQSLMRWSIEEDVESFHICLNTPRVAFIFDHIVAGRPLLSASASLTITQGSAASFPGGDILGNLGVVNTAFSAPLILSRDSRQSLTLLRHHHGDIRLMSDSNLVHVVAKVVSVCTAGTKANGERTSSRRWIHEHVSKRRNCAVIGHIHAPCREVEWVDHEAIDGSLHMLAFINVNSVDTPQVPKSTFQTTRTLAQVPASLSAWHFNRAKTEHNAKHLLASACNVSNGASDNQGTTARSDHVLQPNVSGPILSLAKELLVKSMLLSSAQANSKSLTDLNTTPAIQLHDVKWETTPPDTHVHAVKSTTLHTNHLCFRFFMQSSPYQRVSSSVTLATAAAISAVQQADLIRIQQIQDIVFMTRGGVASSARHEAARCSDEIAVVSRGAALHALARTFSQELLGSFISAYDVTRTEQHLTHGDWKHEEHSVDFINRVGRDIDCRYGAFRHGFTETIPGIQLASNTSNASPPIIPTSGGVLVQVVASTMSSNDALRVKFDAEVTSSVPVSREYRVFVGYIVETTDTTSSESFAVGDCVFGLVRKPVSRYLKVELTNIVPAPRILVAGEPACVAAQLHAAIVNKFPSPPDGFDDSSRVFFAAQELLKGERVEHKTATSGSVSSSDESCRVASKYSNTLVFAPSDSGPSLHKILSTESQTTELFVLAGQDGSTSAVHPDASTAFISGGSGALGAHASLWMATRGGISHIVISGRSGHAKKPSRAMRDLFLSASQVKVIQADVGSSEDTHVAIKQCNISPGYAIVHAGGILADAPVASQTFGGIQTVMAPKVTGMRRLSSSTSVAASAMGAIIGFSSITALLGAAGQANYAAANASLDAAASSTRAAGCIIISIQWGAWSGGGMADPSVVQRARRMGVGALKPREGLDALSLLIASLNANQSSSVMAVSPFDWTKFLSVFSRPMPSFFDRVRSSGAVIFAKDDMPDGIAKTESKIKTDAKQNIVVLADDSSRLEAIVADVTRIARDVTSVNISRSDPLMESGVDSLAGIELKNKIEAAYGVELPATAAFDYPSIDALSHYIVASIGIDESDMQAKNESDIRFAAEFAENVPSAVARHQSRNIAILGYAGFAPDGPGISFSLTRSDDNISAIPIFERWDHDLAGVTEQAESNTATTTAAGRFGAWVPSVSRFDISIFSLSATEAALTDPQQRQLLEATHALTISPTSAPVFAANMGLPAFSPSSRGSVGLIGVAVGISVVDYSRIIPVAVDALPSPYVGAGVAVSVACGRISYSFGFRGPCVAIDTACSSSLVAAHVAWGEIVGEIGPTTAGFIVAGSTLILAPHITRIFSAAGMLAADGRCKTLDAVADGYVRAEATWALPLWSFTVDSTTPAATAAANVTRAAPVAFVSSATNQDGRSGALTAPNGPSQQAVLTSAVRAAVPNLDDTENALEMHGTGTQLGDPIEFGAASAVIKAMREGFEKFKGAGRRGRAGNHIPIALSAVKSSVGHTEAASGIFGLLHAASQLIQRGGGQLQHLRSLTPHAVQVVERLAEQTPFGIARRQNWGSTTIHEEEQGISPTMDPTSGISSFAFQGTNAHAVLRARDNNMNMLRHHNVALESSIFWCAPMLPAILTRAQTRTLNSMHEPTIVIQVDLTIPHNAAMLEVSPMRMKDVIPAEVLLFITTSVASTTLQSANVEDKHQLSCVSVSLPSSMHMIGQSKIDIRLHTNDGNIIATREDRSDIDRAPLLRCLTVNAHSSATETDTRHQKFHLLLQTPDTPLPKTTYFGSIHHNIFGVPLAMFAQNTKDSVSRQRIISVEASKLPSTILEDVEHDRYKRMFSSKKRSDGLMDFASCRSWILAGTNIRVAKHAQNTSPSDIKPTYTPSTAMHSARKSFLKLCHTILRWFFTVWTSNTGSALTDKSDNDSDWQKVYESLLHAVLEILNSDGAEMLRAESSLVDTGFDSLRVLQLQKKLEELGPPGFSFSNGAIFDYTTPAALANYILNAKRTHHLTLDEGRSRTSNNSIRTHGVGRQTILGWILVLSVGLSIFLFTLVVVFLVKKKIVF